MNMVEMLLGRGASQKACSKRTPVSVAIFKHNEDMCLRLLRHLELVDGIQDVLRDDALKEACKAKLVRVVQDLVERMSSAEQAQLDEASCWALRRGFGKERNDDTFKMVSMLLKVGANPDVDLTWSSGQGGSTHTARELAYCWYRDNPKASALYWEGPDTPWWGDRGECFCAHHSQYVKMHTPKKRLRA
jgi:hypothetical protein